MSSKIVEIRYLSEKSDAWEYFGDKIAKIQAAFPSNASFPVEPGVTQCSYLDMFTGVCEDEY